MDSPTPTPTLAGNANRDRQLVNRITYLASLVSVREAIDAKLDILREITATWKPDQAFGEAERQKLRNLEGDLRSYLINKDPLRAFTSESLDERIRASEGKGRNRNLGKLFLVFGLALAMYLLIPLPLSISREVRALVATPLFFTVLTAGTLWFYFSALRNFKPELRKVFAALAASIIVINIEFLQITLTQLMHLDRYPLFQFGTIPGLPLIDVALMYWALLIYAKLLRINTRPSKIILGAMLLGAVALAVMPYPVSADLTPYIKVAAPIVWVATLWWILVAVMARKIMRTASAAYGKSVKWLGIYAVVIALSYLGGIVTWSTSGVVVGEDLNLLSLVLLAVPQAILLYSGYSFKKETEQ